MTPTDIKNLETVCKDAGDSVWKYAPEKGAYYRLYPNGDYIYILSKYLPDPQKVWDNKIGGAVRKGGRVDIEYLKPTPAVFALWEHKNTIAKKVNNG